jgi:putative SOS response-associated peptidase YedK
MKDGYPFAFAGLWEDWGRDGEEIRSCTILTTEANEVVSEVHHRMPVILPSKDYEVWLDSDIGEADWLTPLLVPYYSAELEAYPVSCFVNRPSNDDKWCVEPVA